MRYRLEYVLFRLYGWLAQRPSLETASSWSGALWRALAPYSKRHRRAIAHLTLAYPEKSAAERAAIAAEMWDTMGRVFAESFRLGDIAHSDRIFIENETELQALLARSQGAVACCAHQGNWEIAALVLRQIGVPTAGIYQRIKNPYVDAMARRLREPYYPDGLLPKEHRTALTALRYVKNGGVLSIMSDLREHRGVKVPFFGHPAPSTPFPAMIAVTQEKPMIAAQIIREPDVRFRVRWREVEVARSGDREADIAATTERLQAAFETFIRSHPGQWMWGHKRWG